MKFSPQQSRFLDWCAQGSGSSVLVAVAGAGKTTTLLAGVERIAGQVAILAYNRKISEEIKAKLVERGIEFRKAQAGTCHSFGFNAYRKAFPRARVVEDKVAKIVEARIPDEMKSAAAPIAKLIGLAKQSAFGIVGPIDDAAAWAALADHHDVFDEPEEGDPLDPAEAIAFAIGALKVSNRDTDTVDFDDMIYLPLLLRVRFWRFDAVMIDEAQDTNAARRALVRALVRPGGRVIAVGDPAQAIYGFTGADADSIDLIAKDFNAIRMPLTVTYRCPKAVVAFARQWVDHIEAHESAPAGSVEQLTAAQFVDRFVTPAALDASMAILCRVTKPLVALAFRLIARGIACRVEGREIGAGLKKLAGKWKSARTTDKLRHRLEDFLARETTRYLAKGQEARAQEVDDRVQTLLCIIDAVETAGGSTVAAVDARIDEIFADNVSGVLVLSTIHKSKGREWPTVFWLDRKGTCPSPWARKDWQIGQENNLCYVAATRAQERLIEIPAISDMPIAKPAADATTTAA
jgi:DNA helicase-2/ATP-dependent DNA helicase PcrA